MCVGIPGRVISVESNTATIDVGGVTRVVAIDLLDGVLPGDYLIAHAGFAIHRLDEEEALKTLALIRELAESFGPEGGTCAF